MAECDRAGMAAEIARHRAGRDHRLRCALRRSRACALSALAARRDGRLPATCSTAPTAERRLAGYFGVSTYRGFRRALAPRAHGGSGRHHLHRAHAARRASAALAAHARERKARRCRLMQATRSNLELVRTLAGERRGTLLAAIDRSVTAAGSRLMAQRLAAPLTDPQAIAARHDAVELSRERMRACAADLRARLKSAPDLLRALGAARR